ncbi:hypothetical protein HPP92_016179 [Vanilla planifolia]|uniref:Uncharacterized protein n=1 Tax=Vanilla planifolia TaxID=51239 RepID=A0A835QN56_VANPL|nr:hypothetical protein HPP92_016780 [Vanilla planifolia]KAG0471633.1 hypothetical protein HPP92_016179 [Vanilla planifolia]
MPICSLGFCCGDRGLIRRRQWRRICWENGGNSSVDLIARIEKLEQDTRSSATVVRVLSRQLEKLGTRFRVTRKALKDPIAEAAALAKKNSEVTRALAMQEDILEKELVEIQNVLLLMQAKKQLELIVAIGKAGRLIESNLGSDEEQCSTGESIPVSGKELNELEIQAAGDGNRT